MKDEKNVPEISPELLQQAAYAFVIALVGTNAETVELTLENFHGKDGKSLGNFKVVCKKIS